MARYECERCHATCFTTEPPHLCADLTKRLARQQRQVDAVVGILAAYGVSSGPENVIATDIVAELNRLGVAQ